MANPVVFLDIDGVLARLTQRRSYAIRNSDPFTPEEQTLLNELSGEGDLRGEMLYRVRTLDPELVLRLNDLLERSGASVVISSSWRILFPLRDLQILLRYRGFVGEILGVTPIQGSVRGAEIQAWLSSHEVDHFVILDDDTDMAHLMNHLVRTDPSNGLTLENVEASLLLLG